MADGQVVIEVKLDQSTLKTDLDKVTPAAESAGTASGKTLGEALQVGFQSSAGGLAGILQGMLPKQFAQDAMAVTQAAAQTALAAMKETAATDAQAILTEMEALVTSLQTYVDGIPPALIQIFNDAQVNAVTAGKSFADSMGSGYASSTALKDATNAAMSQTLATALSYNSAFQNAGYSLASSIAAGLRSGASLISGAVSGALANAGNQSGGAAPVRYPHASGLSYVPYDEYPANLHKGEAVLTAQEAALWRGGAQAAQTGATFPSAEQIAGAIWAAAPPGQPVVLSLDGQAVAKAVEPGVSAIQGRKTRTLALGRG